MVVSDIYQSRSRNNGWAIPSDKSISHRILLLSAITPGITKIYKLNLGNAVTLLMTALTELGVSIQQDGEAWVIQPPVDGLAPKEGTTLDLGPSSAAARMLTGVLAGLGLSATIDGDEVLRARPMDWIVDPLRSLGAKIRYEGTTGCLPLQIWNEPGELHGGEVTITIGSAQAYSTVLLAAFASQTAVRLRRKIHSRDHTERMLRYIGVTVEETPDEIYVCASQSGRIDEYVVPVDPSAAVYLAAVHVIQRRKETLRIEQVCINPTRIGFFETIRNCGVPLFYEDVRELYGEPVATVVIGETPDDLKPFIIQDDFLFHSMIDEIPLLCAFASMINGTSSVFGASELIFKETNRLLSTRDMLRAFGAHVEVLDDSIHITGGQPLHAATAPSFGDHRIAMTAAVLASSLEGYSTIVDGTCYETSFIGFTECMQSIGVDISVTE